MPSNYTPNYQLNQWEADDRILRTDFNADNAKIDAALAELAATPPLRFASGTYTGTGDTSNRIEMGFKPKYAQVVRMDGAEQRLYFYDVSSEFIDRNNGIGRVIGGGLSVSATQTGLSVSIGGSYYQDYQRILMSCNSNNVEYVWFAFG